MFQTQNILDLLDTSPSLTTVTSATNASNKSTGGDLLDLLGDLDMGGGSSNGAPNPVAVVPSGGGLLLDGLGGGGGGLNNGTGRNNLSLDLQLMLLVTFESAICHLNTIYIGKSIKCHYICFCCQAEYLPRLVGHNIQFIREGPSNHVTEYSRIICD